MLLSQLFISPQTHGLYVLVLATGHLWALDTFPVPALRAAAQPQRFLRLCLHQPGLMSKTAAFLSCLPHTPSQQGPFRARKPLSVGNAGLRVSCDRHFNLSSLCAKINVSRNLDKSLTVSNARNVPYFLFHYEK